MSLEDKVEDKESKSFMRKAGRLLWKVGMAAATTALSIAALPAVGASASLGIWVGSAFAGGGMIANLIKGKSFYESLDAGLTTYSAVNAIIQPMVWLGDATFPLISNYDITGKIMRGLYAATLYNSAFVGSYRAAGHLVDNYLNPKGITKTISNNFWETWAKIGLVFGPAYAAAANGITSLTLNSYTIPTFAAWALPSGIVLGLSEKDSKQPYSHAPSYAHAAGH